MTEYEPGVCNIGRAERKKRYALGASGAVIALVTAILTASGIFPISGLLLVAAVTFLAFEGFLQGYLSFCAGFASKGIYDVSEEGDEREEVSEDVSRKKDKVKALQIHLYSATGTLALTAIIFLFIQTY